MSALVRDPWSDARRAATQEVLDDDVAVVRRRLRLRRLVVAVVGCAAVGCVDVVAGRWAGLAVDDRWRAPAGSPWVGFGLIVLGFLLTLVGLATWARAGGRSTFVTPDAFLARRDRRWVRKTIAACAAVLPERREVVADTARRMVRDAAYVPQRLGWILLLIGAFVAAPDGVLLVLYGLVVTWTVVEAVTEQVRARRARRWLARHT